MLQVSSVDRLPRLGLRAWISLFALCCALFPARAAAGSVQSAPQSPAPRSIAVVLDDNYPPYIFRGPEGALQGILVDQWSLWEKKTGIKVDLKAMDWSKAQQLMREGQADVIDTLFRTPERERLYAFSAPYARLDVAVFFHKDLGGIADVASLQGFTVGVKDGDACIRDLAERSVTTLRQYPSYEAIIEAAREKKIRVFAMDKPPALYYLIKRDMADQFRVAFTLNSGEFHRAVRKGDEALLSVVERGFAAVGPEAFEAVQRKWLGAPFFGPTLARWVLLALAGACGAALALFVFTLALRRTVRARTVELKSALAALSLTEEKFRTLLENLNLGVFRGPIDPSLFFLHVNPAMAAMLGYDSAEELMALPVCVLHHTLETRDRLMEKLASQGFLRNERIELRKKDGALLPVSVNVQPKFDAAGRILWIDGVVEDVAERIRTEDALRQAMEQADAASRAKTEFLANMSHEIRTPLNGILGMLQLIKAAGPQDRVREYIEHAVVSGRNLVRIINDILDFSKVEAGMITIEQEPFDLAETARSSTGLFAGELAATGAALSLDLDGLPPGLYQGDEGRIRQILFNLIGNAVKFAPRGSILVSIAATRPEDADGRTPLSIRVSDDGIGIAPDKLESIFEPFTQVDGSYAKHYSGTGLGLSIVKRMVDLMGGRITVQSALGKGATVLVDLALKRVVPPPDSETP